MSESHFDALIINPHIQSVTIIDEPPLEKNGSGIPVVGRAPDTTPTFTSDCKKIHAAQPKVPYAEKRSGHFNAILIALYVKKIKSTN